MARNRKKTKKAPEYPLPAPLRIAVCGEISSGKSTVINALLREAVLPDFFGCDGRPLIRLAAGASENAITLHRRDGSTETVTSFEGLEPDADLVEIHVARRDAQPFGPCEIVELPPLRDGHLRAGDIDEIAGCDVLVWTTIGSQAWRLSEKNILDEIGDRRPAQAILVASRADKFRSDADRDRLADRIRRETADYFGTCVLLGASPAGIARMMADRSAWDASGATSLAEALVKAAAELPRDTGPQAVVDASEDAAANVIDLDPHRAIPQSDVPQSAPETAPAPEPLLLVPDVEPEPPRAPSDPLRDFLGTLHGVVAVGWVELGNPDSLEVIAGDEAKVRDFAQFCAHSATTLLAIAGFGGTDPRPEGEQVAMQHHQVIYSLAGKEMLFLVSESAKQSTGIARTVFARLGRIRADMAVSQDAA